MDRTSRPVTGVLFWTVCDIDRDTDQGTFRCSRKDNGKKTFRRQGGPRAAVSYVCVEFLPFKKKVIQVFVDQSPYAALRTKVSNAQVATFAKLGSSRKADIQVSLQKVHRLKMHAVLFAHLGTVAPDAP